MCSNPDGRTSLAKKPRHQSQSNSSPHDSPSINSINLSDQNHTRARCRHGRRSSLGLGQRCHFPHPPADGIESHHFRPQPILAAFPLAGTPRSLRPAGTLCHIDIVLCTRESAYCRTEALRRRRSGGRQHLLLGHSGWWSHWLHARPGIPQDRNPKRGISARLHEDLPLCCNAGVAIGAKLRSCPAEHALQDACRRRGRCSLDEDFCYRWSRLLEPPSVYRCRCFAIRSRRVCLRCHTRRGLHLVCATCSPREGLLVASA